MRLFQEPFLAPGLCLSLQHTRVPGEGAGSGFGPATAQHTWPRRGSDPMATRAPRPGSPSAAAGTAGSHLRIPEAPDTGRSLAGGPTAKGSTLPREAVTVLKDG